MRKGGERRGNTRDRRARKLWMLATFDPELGDNECRCHLGISERCLGPVSVAPGCARGSGAMGGGVVITASTVLAHLRATTAADQAKWLAEALRRHP